MPKVESTGYLWKFSDISQESPAKAHLVPVMLFLSSFDFLGRVQIHSPPSGKGLLKLLMDVMPLHPGASLVLPERQGLAVSGLCDKLVCEGLACALPLLVESRGARAL